MRGSTSSTTDNPDSPNGSIPTYSTSNSNSSNSSTHEHDTPNDLFSEQDTNRDVSSISLMTGELSIDDYDDNVDDDQHEEGGANENSSSDFNLHLPDFEQLMNQHTKHTSPPLPPQPNRTTTSNDDFNCSPIINSLNLSNINSINNNNNNNNKTPITNISIGTAPSVRSQYYHSVASHLDSSEGMSIGGESEYESLFSDESFLSISNEFTDQKQQLINSQPQNHSSNVSSSTPTPTLSLPIAQILSDDEGYQTPTSQPSYHSSSNKSLLSSSSSPSHNYHSSSTKSIKSLSPAASKLLNSATTISSGRSARSSRSPNRQSNHRRLEQSIDFLNDDHKTMTYSRKIALFLSKRYKWYNPRLNNIYANINRDNSDENNEEEQREQQEEQDMNENDVEGLTNQCRKTTFEKYGNCSEPSIEVAWAYYEHMTLPRYLLRDKTTTNEATAVAASSPHDVSLSPSGPGSLQKSKSGALNTLKSSITKHKKKNRQMTVAAPGEMNFASKLYSPWTTPLSQMGDFGLGVGLYFGTLRAFTALLFLAGVLNIPNLVFYGGKDYSNYQEGIVWFLKGSAACNEHTWVPCLDCSEDDKSPFNPFEKSYRNHTLTNAMNQTMTFALKNECDGALFRVGMVNFGTVLLFIIGMICMASWLKKKQVEFDLDEQTAQDYSICIKNPPSDAYDPEEWRKYFKDNFPSCEGMHVTSLTVAVDNDELLSCLTKRRELIEKLKHALPDDINTDDVENVTVLHTIVESILKESNCIQKLYANRLGAPAMYKSLIKLNEKIKVHAKEECPVTEVFVMFETEKVQRYVLEKLTVSKHNVNKNNINALSDPNYLFRGKLVLDVTEAEEPSTVRWKELKITNKDMFAKVFTTLVVLGLIVTVAYIVRWCNEKNDSWAAIAIALFNRVFPQVAKFISTSFERHSREEHMQVWLYFKIAFFRWVNTAIVIWIVTPFTSTTMEEGLLLVVYKIFLAEILTTNVLKWLDIGENFKKHFIAPRALTQEKMNSNFRGSEVFLAERYTNLTKIVFLSVWYCSIYPAVLFFGAIALWVNYYLDRFAIMRTWRPQPKLGVSISHYTKYFIFPLTVIAMTFFGNYMWGSFRFDYLCDTRKYIPSDLVGSTWEIPNKTIPFTDAEPIFSLLEGTTYYEFCREDRYTKDQFRLKSAFDSLFYTNISIVILVFVAVLFFIAKTYFYTKYEPVGDDRNIPMRHVESMTAYIPQVPSDSFSYPLIACNVEKIKDSNLFEWEDPLRPYEYYDLTKDLRKILAEDESGEDDDDGEKNDGTMDENRIFSKMVYWPYRSVTK